MARAQISSRIRTTGIPTGAVSLRTRDRLERKWRKSPQRIAALKWENDNYQDIRCCLTKVSTDLLSLVSSRQSQAPLRVAPLRENAHLRGSTTGTPCWRGDGLNTDRVATNGGYYPRMPQLVVPIMQMETAWREGHEEWGPGSHEDEFGLLPTDDVDSHAGFAHWLARLAEEANPEALLAIGRVHCTYRWIVDRDQLVGGIALRHELNDFLIRAGGHIGYGIRPSARRRGLATWALGQMLTQAKTRSLDQVLIVCDVNNVASAKVIEHHGGAMEDVRQTELGMARSYWI